MVKFGLVTLHFRKIPIIKVARILQLIVLEYDYATSLITHCKVVARLIKTDCGQNIIVRYILLLTLA